MAMSLSLMITILSASIQKYYAANLLVNFVFLNSVSIDGHTLICETLMKNIIFPKDIHNIILEKNWDARASCCYSSPTII